VSHSKNHIDTGATTVFYQGVAAGKAEEQERIVKIITKRMDYDCRCRCECHDEPSPCISCQADGELIQIIKGEIDGLE